jgi:CBS domain-containing protein
MQCEDLMHEDVECARGDDDARTVARRMKERDIGFIPVCDDEKRVIGTITDRDLAIRLVAEGKPGSTRASDLMTRQVVACRGTDDIGEAERLMAKHQKSRILCVDDEEHLIGVITLADISQEEEPDRVGDTIRHVKQGAPQTHA